VYLSYAKSWRGPLAVDAKAFLFVFHVANLNLRFDSRLVRDWHGFREWFETYQF
jgi:hypothetical protein